MRLAGFMLSLTGLLLPVVDIIAVLVFLPVLDIIAVFVSTLLKVVLIVVVTELTPQVPALPNTYTPGTAIVTSVTPDECIRTIIDEQCGGIEVFRQ